MKSKLLRFSSIIPLVGILCLAAMPAHVAKICIVATLTDLADLARNIKPLNLITAIGIAPSHSSPEEKIGLETLPSPYMVFPGPTGHYCMAVNF